MDAFDEQLKDRLPLACATLELFDFVFDQPMLAEIYQRHRGRCYEDELRFTELLSLVRDALLQHQGSGHRLFLELERDQSQPVDESNFYRKLSRMPVAVSRALLRQCSARLNELMPVGAVLLPGCFEPFAAVVIDGKKIKRATHRLKPTRGYSGSLLGAKALVAMNGRIGLAIAMSDSLDGETNDVPLVSELVAQVKEVIDEPILWMADRQFCDLKTLDRLSERGGDRFVVRVREGLNFQVQTQHRMRDEQGREVVDELGIFGSGKKAKLLRRITLLRLGEDDVILITDLMDQKEFDALDLLKLYRRRWGIEQMFQQVTETFSLEHLIGCRPQAILFQFALCLLMYNLIQVLKSYVAEDGCVPMSIVSTYGLFYDVKRELHTWAYLGHGEWSRREYAKQEIRVRLRSLLSGSWDPVAYTKASDKQPRKKKPTLRRIEGGHTSVQRLLTGTAKARQP